MAGMGAMGNRRNPNLFLRTHNQLGIPNCTTEGQTKWLEGAKDLEMGGFFAHDLGPQWAHAGHGFCGLKLRECAR